MIAPSVELRFVSIADYLEQEKTSEIKHDYVGGILYALPGTSMRHSELAINITSLLVGSVRRSGCRMFAESVKLHPTPDSFYYPDVIVTCDAPQDNYVADSACLIVEILSPSTEARDKLEKWAAYKQMSSLQHYLLVHQDEPWIEHFQRDDVGQWQLSHHQDGEISLTCPKMTLALTDVYTGILDV